jgi:hypothetical protein
VGGDAPLPPVLDQQNTGEEEDDPDDAPGDDRNSRHTESAGVVDGEEATDWPRFAATMIK